MYSVRRHGTMSTSTFSCTSSSKRNDSLNWSSGNQDRPVLEGGSSGETIPDLKGDIGRGLRSCNVRIDALSSAEWSQSADHIRVRKDEV